jgi:hypothetical protein
MFATNSLSLEEVANYVCRYLSMTRKCGDALSRRIHQVGRAVLETANTIGNQIKVFSI